MQKYCENIVVGNGIMAKQLMFGIKDIFSDITCISSKDFAPDCSSNSTSINCLRGTKRGTSKLGDLILNSHESFEKFFKENKPQGVSKSSEVQTWEHLGESHDKWLRRYGEFKLSRELKYSKNLSSKDLCVVNTDAYIISTQKLFSWYQEELSSIKFKEGFVVKIIKDQEHYHLTLKSGQMYKCKRLFLCTSYLSGEFLDLVVDPQTRASLVKQKKVYGHYLQYHLEDDEDCGFDLSRSFSFSYDFIRLIYRKETHDFVMSFPDQNKDSFLFSSSSLEEAYKEFTQVLNLSDMPQFSSFILKQGIRSKGHKRMPFFGEINQNLFLCSGLYKNAFVFSYYFTQKYLYSLNK